MVHVGTTCCSERYLIPESNMADLGSESPWLQWRCSWRQGKKTKKQSSSIRKELSYIQDNPTLYRLIHLPLMFGAPDPTAPHPPRFGLKFTPLLGWKSRCSARERGKTFYCGQGLVGLQCLPPKDWMWASEERHNVVFKHPKASINDGSGCCSQWRPKKSD